jgi:Zn-dependent membrane protease YugP
MSILAFFYMIDPVWWILTIVLAIPAGIAAARVKSTFARFSRVATHSGVSGAEAAQIVLQTAGLRGLRIERHQGFLTDHYDPRGKVLRLSPGVYDGRSVAAVAVAAHEAGHALQDAKGYVPLRLRSALVPATNLGNRLWMLPFLLGIFTGVSGWIYVSIALFGAVVLFQLVTLPTEFDASRRAKLALAQTGVVAGGAEAEGVGKVLNAAAMTYVAAALTAVVQLLYLILVAGRRN